MTKREIIKRKIREVISNAKDAFALGDLFTPEGLFSHLAKTKAERAKLVRSPLFKEAQRRFHALQYKEVEEIFGKPRRRVPLATAGITKKNRKTG